MFGGEGGILLWTVIAIFVLYKINKIKTEKNKMKCKLCDTKTVTHAGIIYCPVCDKEYDNTD
ncbi:MAG: hypothetical protein H8E98_01155 [Bacteroidetes bacterium]|nr:hypothetical protein [Bacteroidota bacterium]